LLQFAVDTYRYLYSSIYVCFANQCRR